MSANNKQSRVFFRLSEHPRIRVFLKYELAGKSWNNAISFPSYNRVPSSRESKVFSSFFVFFSYINLEKRNFVLTGSNSLANEMEVRDGGQNGPWMRKDNVIRYLLFFARVGWKCEILPIGKSRELFIFSNVSIIL